MGWRASVRVLVLRQRCHLGQGRGPHRRPGPRGTGWRGGSRSLHGSPALPWLGTGAARFSASEWRLLLAGSFPAPSFLEGQPKRWCFASSRTPTKRWKSRRRPSCAPGAASTASSAAPVSSPGSTASGSMRPSVGRSADRPPVRSARSRTARSSWVRFRVLRRLSLDEAHHRRGRELAPSARGDLVSTSAIVGVAGPSAGGFLEPGMTGLQPLLELDRHKHAHLTCLVDP